MGRGGVGGGSRSRKRRVAGRKRRVASRKRRVASRKPQASGGKPQAASLKSRAPESWRDAGATRSPGRAAASSRSPEEEERRQASSRSPEEEERRQASSRSPGEEERRQASSRSPGEEGRQQAAAVLGTGDASTRCLRHHSSRPLHARSFRISRRTCQAARRPGRSGETWGDAGATRSPEERQQAAAVLGKRSGRQADAVLGNWRCERPVLVLDVCRGAL